MRVPSLVVAGVLATLPACANGEPQPDAPAAAQSAAVAAAEPVDPCALIPIAEWTEATGYADIRTDRSSGNTCDYLSDDLWGVVGSVVLPGRALMEHPPGIAGEPERIDGLGDEALWLRLGPAVRVDDTVVWVTVNPNIENQRDVAIALARIAIAHL